MADEYRPFESFDKFVIAASPDKAWAEAEVKQYFESAAYEGAWVKTADRDKLEADHLETLSERNEAQMSLELIAKIFNVHEQVFDSDIPFVAAVAELVGRQRGQLIELVQGFIGAVERDDTLSLRRRAIFAQGTLFGITGEKPT